MEDNYRKLRQQKGFALFWWWRGWIGLGLLLCRIGAPAGLVNAVGAVATW